MVKVNKIKIFFLKIISDIARNDIGWMLLAPLIVIADYAKLTRRKHSRELIKNAINIVFPDFIVRHGPFKGMKYLEAKSSRGNIFPKILGSYEKEIQHIIEECCKQEYTEVVNIGCAEGYYAIGFAMRIPKARIYAFDINEKYRYACQAMAKLNEVEQRVILGSLCNSEKMKNIPFKGKALIFSDCEGYEKILFTEELIPILRHHDLLIELHDFIDINISSIIRKRFERTHKIIAVKSIDDIEKAKTYNYEELAGYNLQERKQLLGEFRPSIMQWFYMKSLEKL